MHINALSNQSVRFGINRRKAQPSLDKKAEQQYDQGKKDAAFLELRRNWFKENRKKESEEEGYVTTPEHSDDEGRPSARKYARETNRIFDAFGQFFRKKHKKFD
jgi:hypothetical protein